MEEPQQSNVAVVQDSPVPSDDVIRSKWPELAKVYESKPRLASMLSTTSLTIAPAEDDTKVVTFNVVNDAQKDWVESKLLHELEGNFRKISGSVKVYLRVAVMPDDTPSTPQVYMPGDQAKVLMAQNEDVKNLVRDLELDIK